MEIGLFNWFNSQGNYGMIRSLSGQNVFFHVSAWIEKKVLIPERIIPMFFDITDTERGKTAINVRYFKNEIDDWKCLLKLSANGEIIFLSDRGKIEEINIVEYCISSLKTNANTEPLITSFSQYLISKKDFTIEYYSEK